MNVGGDGNRGGVKTVFDNNDDSAVQQRQKINFKLSQVIDNTVDKRIKKESIADYYRKHKEGSCRVGTTTTYNVVGRRDYKKLDEKLYKI